MHFGKFSGGWWEWSCCIGKVRRSEKSRTWSLKRQPAGLGTSVEIRLWNIFMCYLPQGVNALKDLSKHPECEVAAGLGSSLGMGFKPSKLRNIFMCYLRVSMYYKRSEYTLREQQQICSGASGKPGKTRKLWKPKSPDPCLGGGQGPEGKSRH